VIADLHCHYPMHIGATVPETPLRRMTQVRRRHGLGDRFRAAVLATAARLLNHRRHFGDDWRVGFDGLREGGVSHVFSVLYQPFDEIDLDEPYGSDPEDGYVEHLKTSLAEVEADLGERAVIVKTLADLDRAEAEGRPAFFHCVEGGFHLGRTEQDVRDNVRDLKRCGVTYITLAHLFWRQIATNAPALPFLPDRVYDLVFRQPRGVGLTKLGRAAVEAMYEHRILVDVSHMRAEALRDTFALLRDLDREHGREPERFPVISSHAGYRFRRNGQRYLHDRDTIDEIRRRDGVIGLIMARHQLQDGLSDGDDLAHTVGVVQRHVAEIGERWAGIGSDLDGFIRPTMAGVERAEDLRPLGEAFAAAHAGDAQAVLSGNALRVVRTLLA
jgi:microsomal dipeptidase-like Zn-dependent dipeptidase